MGRLAYGAFFDVSNPEGEAVPRRPGRHDLYMTSTDGASNPTGGPRLQQAGMAGAVSTTPGRRFNVAAVSEVHTRKLSAFRYGGMNGGTRSKPPQNPHHS